MSGAENKNSRVKAAALAIARRFREPSTWAGLAVLGAVLGVRELSALSNPELAGLLAAIVAALLPERGA